MSSYCNFDRSSGGTAGSMSDSDCYEECTVDLGCEASFLGNGICDSSCNYQECGYDWGDCGYCANGCSKEMLQAATCSQSCNVSQCFYQLSICQECEYGCTNSLLTNDSCDSECNFHQCNYDNSKCTYSECADGCESHMINNEECEEACNVAECSYDNYKCNCSIYCLKSSSDGTCDYDCDNEECEFDFGDCGDCASGCFEADISNDVCDSACDNKECNWDNNSCRCSVDCPFSNLGMCSDGCLNPDCEYDEYSGYSPCTMSEQQLYALYYHFIVEDFNRVRNTTACSANGCDLTMPSTNYCEVCNIPDCVYAMGDCQSSCHEDCEKCYGEAEDNCLMCKSGKKNYYTTCVDDCPMGFVAKTYSFISVEVCIPDTSTQSTSETPAEIYVNVRSDSSYGSGTTSDPFSLLSIALVSAFQEYTTIYLMTEGPHRLGKVPEDYTMSNAVNDLTDPLNRSNFAVSKISIVPMEATATLSITDFSDIMKFSVTTELELSNLTIEGASIHSCTNTTYCDYCPYVTTTNGVTTSDRGNVITEYFSDCSQYENIALFELAHKANITLNSVHFENLRMELSSLFVSKGASITLNDVSFSNIRTSNYVIKYQDCTGYSDCGNFTFNGGSLTLLNNGFEFGSNIDFRGFLEAPNIFNILIEDVEFSYNLAYTDEESSKDIYALIVAEEFYTFTVRNSEFKNNYLTNGLFYLNPQKLSMDYSFNGSSTYIKELLIDHVVLENNVFTHNYASESGILAAYYQRTLQNIYLSNLTISHNWCEGGPLFLISNQKMTDEYKFESTIPVVIDGTKTEGVFTERTLTIRDLDVSNNNFYLGLLDVEKGVNIEMTNLQIYSNKDSNQTLDTLVDLFKENEEAYLSLPMDQASIADCTQLMRISNSYNLNFTDSTIRDNECLDYSPLFETTGHELLYMYKVIFDDNSGQSADNPVGAKLDGFSDFLLEDCHFTNLVNYLGVSAMESSGEMNMELTNVSFKDNIGSHSGTFNAMSQKVTISKTTFENNKITSSGGGALTYTVSYPGSILNIYNSEFTGNRCELFYGGAITILDASGAENSLSLFINETTFEENYANLRGSVLYTDTSLVLNNTAAVHNCEFKRNHVSGTGNIYLIHRTGSLVFQKCYFYGNIAGEDELGTGAVIYGSTAHLNITDCIFKENKGGSLIYYSDSESPNMMETYNCVFTENNGTVVHLVDAEWFDNSTTISNNQYLSSTGAMIEYNSFAELQGTQFLENSAYQGGAIILRTQSSLFAIGCTFSKNIASFMGGALFAEQESSFFIYDSTFYSNSATKGSAIGILGCETAESSIEYSKFYENRASETGTISVIIGTVTINTSKIYSNVATAGTPGIAITTGTVNVKSSDFYDQASEVGVFIYSTTNSKLTIDDSSFKSGKSEASGGAIYAIFTEVAVTYSVFEDIESHGAASLHVAYGSNLSITYSSFSDIKSSSAVYIFSIEAVVEHCIFSSFEDTAVYAEDLPSFAMKNSTFSSGNGDEGGALHLLNIESIAVEDSTFQHLSSGSGGAIYIFANVDMESSEVATITNSDFIYNSATKGGAIYSDEMKLSIESCNFSYNYARSAEGFSENTTDIIDGKGGAMLLLCSSHSYCTFSISDTEFYNNTADYNGGAIAWEDVKPTVSSSVFSNNSAAYGSDLASFSIKVMQTDSEGNILDYSRRLQSYPVAGNLSSVAPGQEIDSVSFAVVDHYNNIVATDNSNSIFISGEGDTQVSGTTQLTTSHGISNFTNLIVSSTPGTSVQINVQASGIDMSKSQKANDDATYNNIVVLDIELRECVLGEATIGSTCTVCLEDFFSLDPSDSECTTCPDDKATCYGGDQIVPKAGYWRASYSSTTFYSCPNAAACEGGEKTEDGSISYTGRCASGYKGNKCQSCDSGHSRSSIDVCGICLSDSVNALRLLGIMILSGLLLVILIKTSLESAYKLKAMHSVYLKIFVNYLQLVMLTASFNLDWPEEVEDFFSIHETAGTVTEQAFSVDCYLDTDKNDPDGVYYKKLIVLSLMPLFLALMATGGWVIICMYYRKWNYMKDELIGTMVILLFLIHPTMVKIMFSSMNCTQIEQGEYWLRDNMDIQCWDSEHVFYIVTTAIPSIIVWGIAIPTICLFSLIKHRKRLGKLSIRKQYGFLFNGFTKRGYYWEFVIIYRKILIICCSVFVANISVSIQALTVMILLLISLMLQIQYEPYSEDKLNTMEIRSIMVSVITIYCGLYYLTGKLDEASRMILFFVILIVNIYFLVVWLKAMFGAGMEVLAVRSKWIRRFCVKKVRDGYSDEMFHVQEHQQHVIGKHNDKYYTLVRSDSENKTIVDPVTGLHHQSQMRDLFLIAVNNSINGFDYDNFIIPEVSEYSEEDEFNKTSTYPQSSYGM